MVWFTKMNRDGLSDEEIRADRLESGTWGFFLFTNFDKYTIIFW